MDGSGLPPKLLTSLSKAADTVRRHDFINVYSHFDSDGITSASIIAEALIREGKAFTVTIFPVLSSSQMEIVRNDDPDCLLMTDLGASYIPDIDALRGDSIVLDHHVPGETETLKTVYANPHLYGIDGGKNCCGATLALLFATTLDERNWDLAPISTAGMIGDMQVKDGVKDLNKFVIDTAVSKGTLERTPGSLIPNGDVAKGLLESVFPYIDGVTDDEKGVADLLAEVGLKPGALYRDLTDEQRQKLSSLIAIRLASQGVSVHHMEEAVHDRYTDPRNGTDCATISGALDACGRNDLQDLGISAGTGDRDSLNEAIEYDASLRRSILDAVAHARGNINEMSAMRWIDSTGYGNGGLVASVLLNYLAGEDKPIVSVNVKDDITKVSSRGTDTLIARGLDLCAAMREACSAAGGEGGGHKIASGGQFPNGNLETFLENADRVIGEQIGRAK